MLTSWLVSFLIYSALISIFSGVFVANDSTLDAPVKAIAILFKFTYVIWAVVLIIMVSINR